MTSYLTKIRNIPIADDSILKMFDSEQGLVNEPTAGSDLMVATISRIIIFKGQKNRTTDVLSKESVNRVSVREQRRNFPLLTMVSFFICSLIVYLGVAYWVVDNTVQAMLPGINLALTPIVLLIGLSLGLVWLWKSYNFKSQMIVSIFCDGGIVSEFSCSIQHRNDLLNNVVYFQAGIDV